ncbi:MAG TPA: NlpC/P60 family protein [Roseiflexaceae bacterium]|nr:NlpC/P60 family protein [Roseiflexaceae bacterium]
MRSIYRMVLVLLAVLPLLGCVTLPWALREGTVASSIPRWACPTPTPLPWGEDGPIKRTETISRDGQLVEVDIRWEQWEQEYPDAGGPPFPAPTPYTRSGTSYLLGQLVNVSPELDLRATVRRTEVLTGAQRLYMAELAWINRSGPLPFSPARQVVLSSVRRADGRQVGGDGWAWSLDAAQLAQAETSLPSVIPPGEASFTVPILAPDGEPQTLDVRLDREDALAAVRVQFAAGSDPNCAHDGTVAAQFGATPIAVQGPPPPAQAPDVVAWARTQLGRPYCWGGKGWVRCSGCDATSGCVTPSCDAQGGLPCWDCSGLTWGAWNAFGVSVGHGTSNQQHQPAVWRPGQGLDPATVAQLGDLLLFTSGSGPSGRINHVGLYAGDGVMVHASNYPDGVIETPRIFENRYYGSRLVLIARPEAKGS